MSSTRTRTSTKRDQRGSSSRRILARITCPHCWEHFSPERVLWISEHSDLLDDPRLGPEHQQRFLPTRFTVAGQAIDGKGFPCYQLACPKCHLIVPTPLLEMEPLFLSIFGGPSSGKSFFLAAMAWELRKILPLTFSIDFSDADPDLNRHLNDYEGALFANAKPKNLVPLQDLISKTFEEGNLFYDTVSYGSQTVKYPRPLLFGLQPQERHPNTAKRDRLARVVCLYDNAGESFLPGYDTGANPVTRHMAQSRVLFFVFDPTSDSRFQARIGGNRIGQSQKVYRQEPVLQEASARIRRYSGIPQRQKHHRPLLVILTKFDQWSKLLGTPPAASPWVAGEIPSSAGDGSSVKVHALETAIVDRQSRRAREVLLELSPEIVTAAEGFADEVIYVPVSAVGWKTEWNDSNGQLAIRPGDAEPYWVTVPFLYALSRSIQGLIPIKTHKASQ